MLDVDQLRHASVRLLTCVVVFFRHQLSEVCILGYGMCGAPIGNCQMVRLGGWQTQGRS